MKDHIAPEAKITTDKWTGYQPLKEDFENLTQIYSGDKGGNFPELHSVIMNLKYCYRFNRSFMSENIFDNLINSMVVARPCYIKNISCKCLSQKRNKLQSYKKGFQIISFRISN